MMSVRARCVRAHVCVRARAHMRVREYMRACVHACVRACICVCIGVSVRARAVVVVYICARARVHCPLLFYSTPPLSSHPRAHTRRHKWGQNSYEKGERREREHAQRACGLD